MRGELAAQDEMASLLTSRQGVQPLGSKALLLRLGAQEALPDLGRKAAMSLSSALSNYLVYLFHYWPGLMPGAGKY